MPKGRRQNIAESRWEEQKSAIQRLYLDEKRPLSGRDSVIEVMRERGFEASKWQYENHIERWNFRKKLTRDVWHIIKHVIDQRRADGLESIVYAYGSRLKDSRVMKETQRYKVCRTDEEFCRKIALPPEVEVVSPPEVALTTTTTQITENEDSQLSSRDLEILPDLDLLRFLPQDNHMGHFFMPLLEDNDAAGAAAAGGGNDFFQFPENSFLRSTFSPAPITMGYEMVQEDDQALVPLLPAHGLTCTAIAATHTGIPESTASLLADLMPNIFGGAQSSHRIDTESSHVQQPMQALIRSPTHVAVIRHIMYVLMNNFAGAGSYSFYTTLEQVKQFSLSQLEDLLNAVPSPFDAALEQGLLTIGIKSNVPRMVRFLLRRGLDINTAVCHDESGVIVPLGLACKLCRLNIVRVLLEHKIDVNRIHGEIKPFSGFRSSAIACLFETFHELSVQRGRFRESVEYPGNACEIFRCLLKAGAEVTLNELNHIEIWKRRILLEIYTEHAKNGVHPDDIYLIPPPSPVRSRALPPPRNPSILPVDDMPYLQPPLLLPETPNILALALKTMLFGNEAVSLKMIKMIYGDESISGPSQNKNMDDIARLLHLASFLGFTTMIEYCVSMGANVTSVAWCEAIRGGKGHVLKKFMEYQGDSSALALESSLSVHDHIIFGRSVEAEGPLQSVPSIHEGIYLNTPECIRTPLSEAYRFRNKDCIQFFQNLGLKKILITDEGFNDSLHAFLTVAAETGDMQMLKLLSEAADILPGLQDRISHSVYTACLIEKTICEGHEDCVQMLLDLGFAPGWRALALAISERNEDLTNLLLDIPVGLNNPFRLLLHAIRWGNGKIISKLLHAGILLQTESIAADPARRSIPGREPSILDLLSEAMNLGDKSLIELLMKISIRNSRTRLPQFESALEMAIKRGRDDIALELISCGDETNDPYALMEAASRSKQVFKALLSAFRIQHPDGHPYFAREALRQSIEHRDMENLRMLGTFADLNLMAVWSNEFLEDSYDGSGMDQRKTSTLLGEAIFTNDVAIVKAVLEMGGDAKGVVAIKHGGRILALSQAILVDNLDMVRLLCDFGAETNFEARLGIKHTALQLAVGFENYEMAEFLLERGVNPNAPPCLRGGANAMQAAAKNGDIGIADLLYRYHVDVNAPGSRFLGKTAFEFAAENGRMDMLLWLYHHELDIYSDGGKQLRNSMNYAEAAGQVAARDLVVKLAADVGINAIAMKKEWEEALRKRVEDKFQEDWSTWL